MFSYKPVKNIIYNFLYNNAEPFKSILLRKIYSVQWGFNFTSTKRKLNTYKIKCNSINTLILYKKMYKGC